MKYFFLTATLLCSLLTSGAQALTTERGPREKNRFVEFLGLSFQTLDGMVTYSQDRDEPQGFCAGMCLVWLKSDLLSDEENRCWQGFDSIEKSLAAEVAQEIRTLQAPFANPSDGVVAQFERDIARHLPSGYVFNEELNRKAKQDSLYYGPKSVLLHYLKDGFSALILVKRVGGGLHAVSVRYKQLQGLHSYSFLDPNFGEYSFSSLNQADAHHDLKRFLDQFLVVYQTHFNSSLSDFFLIEGPEATSTSMEAFEKEAGMDLFNSDEF